MGWILIVDDEEGIRSTLYELLSNEHRCETAASAEEALALLAVNSYDVVLTDISLPGLSGLELLGHVLQKHADTPVIVISGIGDQEHAQGMMRLGAFDYLLKPFRLEVVEESVKRAIGSRGGSASTSQAPPDQGSDAGADGRTSGDWHIVKDNL